MQTALLIINGWNCQDYVRECLASVAAQTYKQFSVIIIDDASTDNTFIEIQKFALSKKIDISYKHVTTIENIGTAKCRLLGEKIALDSGIEYDFVVWLDMDDMLLPTALEVVAKYYEDPDCWLTYGNMITKSSGTVYMGDLEINKCIRTETWKYIHLRTHRKGLTSHIKDEDLEGYLAYPDINMLYCMAELAGKEHIRVIKEPLYIYRDQHSNICINKYSWGQRNMEKIKAMHTAPKKQLDKL